MIARAFHEGEQAVQARLGVRDRLTAIGPQVIRAFMPDQHRGFFEQLPFVVVGSVDTQGQPWASVLARPPGFITSPDALSLLVQALPQANDPLNETLVAGASIGLLGIEPHTRRRNRMNGLVGKVAGTGFSVRVSQSFGNCPKYIQARESHFCEPDADQPGALQISRDLDSTAQHMIAKADTFFIASAYPFQAKESDGDAAHGVDVSHRGGKPGFVRVDGAATLTVPDFQGNFFFNTLGNIAINPRVGLLFIDFENGDLLHVAASAEIIWDGPELAAFTGAQRLLRFQANEVRYRPASLPLRWSATEQSPVLRATGSWPAATGAQ